jgi:hypothetical protein
MLETSLGAIARLRSLEIDVSPEPESNSLVLPSLAWPREGKIEIQSLYASYK